MFFKGLFGVVDVREEVDTITITGIRPDALSRILNKIWKTSVIEKHMFKTIGRTGVVIPKFFAVELVYMLNKMLDEKVDQSSLPKKTIRQIRDTLLEKTFLRNTQENAVIPKRLNQTKLNLFNFKPLVHQSEFLSEYEKKVGQYSLNGYLLHGAVGSGKTITTLMLAEMLETTYTVVICPKIILHKAWISDINKAYRRPPKYWASDSGLPIQGDERIFLCHYEYMAKLIPQLKRLKKDFTIILDECHNLNEPKSQRTQTFWELCRLTESKNVIPMSGTPIKAMGGELISVLKCLDPFFTQDVQDRFMKIFGSTGKKANDIVAHRLGLLTYRMENKVMTLDKPVLETLSVTIPNGQEFTLEAISVKMRAFVQERTYYYKERMPEFQKRWQQGIEDALAANPKGRTAIVEYRDNLVPLVSKHQGAFEVSDQVKQCKQIETREIIPYLKQVSKKDFSEACTIVKYVSLKIQGECLGRIVGRARIDAHVAMTRAVPFMEIVEQAEKKTIVFTTFVEVVEEADRICRQQGLQPSVIYAKFATKANAIVTEFEKSPIADPLIATFASLSTGIPLVMANTVIMINVPFRPHIQEQAIGRVHRIGQDTATKIYTCILETNGKPNISTRGVDIINWAQQNVEEITGVKSPYQIEEKDNEMAISNEAYGIEIESLPKIRQPNVLWGSL